MRRSPWRVLVLLNLLAVMTAGCTLRHWGARRGIEIGTAASSVHLGDVRYGAVLGREFDLLTPENELKWDVIHPRPGVYDFARADALFEYAASHRMRVRGTPLLWHFQNPAWLTDGAFTRAELHAVLVDHIATLLGRYPDVVQWDVVNEAFDDSGRRRASVWQQVIGGDYVDLAFKAARRADADAKLYYNDYNIEFPGPKADAVFQMVSSMKQRGIPIDGVGLQMHALSNFPTPAQVRAEMRRYENIGVDVAITEMDVRLHLPADHGELEAQKGAYAGTLQACLDAPNCNTFVVWGFTDRYSWIPLFFPGYGAADLFDREYRRNPPTTASSKSSRARERGPQRWATSSHRTAAHVGASVPRCRPPPGGVEIGHRAHGGRSRACSTSSSPAGSLPDGSRGSSGSRRDVMGRRWADHNRVISVRANEPLLHNGLRERTTGSDPRPSPWQ